MFRVGCVWVVGKGLWGICWLSRQGRLCRNPNSLNKAFGYTVACFQLSIGTLWDYPTPIP